MRAVNRGICRFFRAAVVVGSFLLLLPATPAGADQTYSETVGGVTHTWTNYTNAGGIEGPTIAPSQTVQIQCYVMGHVWTNGNGYWYQIASSPWNGQYYASADAFYNNGATSGSLVGTPWVDPAVPACGSAPPLPQPQPSVHLDQSGPAQVGYWYAISIANFSAGAVVSVSCRDSRDPSGFRTFTLSTDASGQASTDQECYSNDGPDHWVVADGVESNHVQWDSVTDSGGGNTGGGSTSVPIPVASSTPAGQYSPTPSGPGLTYCNAPSGADALPYVGDALPALLFQHYLRGHGTPVFLDWRYFSGSEGTRSTGQSLAVGETGQYSPPRQSTLEFAIGTFTVCRKSEVFYGIRDGYDFTPDKLQNLPYVPLWALQFIHQAANFDVYSSGNF